MRELRRYETEDFEDVMELLRENDVRKADLGTNDSNTTVLMSGDEMLGFFTWSWRGQMPVLQHFVVKETGENELESLSHSRNFLTLIGEFEDAMRDFGFSHFVIDLNVKRPRVCHVAERYFRGLIRQVTAVGDKRYYLVEVRKNESIH